jgi:hypothetical protein
MSMKQPTETIPHFASEAEARAFWEGQDSTDYLDWSQAQSVVLPKPDRALQDWDEYVHQFDEERRASSAPGITSEEIAQEIKVARAERRAGLAPSPPGRGLG